MARKLTAAAAIVALSVMLVATSTTAHTGQTCSATPNPLVNLNYNNEAVKACVLDRCITTLNVTPTVVTSGYCNGVATSESSVPCNKLEMGYNMYYACLVRALNGTSMAGLRSFGLEAVKFFTTPGFPYHLSVLGCYTCNHFRETVFPKMESTCSNWTCSSISSQSPSAPAYGQPDKGYNYRLCSTGCITGIMMIPFVVVVRSVSLACGCCWPSPSLKTTYEARLQEEKAKKAKRSEDDDDDPHELVNSNCDVVHEPAPVKDQKRHPETVADRAPSQ